MGSAVISFAERIANLPRQNDTALWLPTVAAAIETTVMVKNVLFAYVGPNILSPPWGKQSGGEVGLFATDNAAAGCCDSLVHSLQPLPIAQMALEQTPLRLSTPRRARLPWTLAQKLGQCPYPFHLVLPLTSNILYFVVCREHARDWHHRF